MSTLVNIDHLPPQPVEPAQPVVYLTLQGKHSWSSNSQGEHICNLRIRLTCGPYRRQQWLDLCTSVGGATYKGVTFTDSWGVGGPGERLCNYSGHRTARGDTTTTPTVGHHLEDHPTTKARVEGAVTGYWGNHTRFGTYIERTM